MPKIPIMKINRKTLFDLIPPTLLVIHPLKTAPKIGAVMEVNE